MLKLFINKLSANDKYSLLNRDNLIQLIQMHLSQKQETFSQSFCASFKFPLCFEHFQEKMNLIADVFPKLLIPKCVLR